MHRNVPGFENERFLQLEIGVENYNLEEIRLIAMLW